jgi:hypothetical protein
VDADAPVAVLLAVTLSAHAVRLLERHRLSAREMKTVAIPRVVTVETPAMFLVVLEHDVIVGVDELATRLVGGQVLLDVTLGAREYAVRERRRRRFNPKRSFRTDRGCRCRGNEANGGRRRIAHAT